MSDPQVVVVGSGPAGIAAALAASEAGARVTLIDEHPIDSSMMGLDIPYLFGQRMTPTVRDQGLMLQRAVAANPGIACAQEAGVDVQPGVYVWGSFRDRQNSRHVMQPVLGLGNDRETWMLEYDRLVLATGARDLSLSFPGRDLVGVVGAQGMCTLIEKYQAFSGTRVAILGSGDLALTSAALALDHGMEVAAIVEPGPELRSPGSFSDDLKGRGVPFYTSHAVIEARGSREVESLVLSSPSGTREILCDTVCLAIGLVPSVELPYLTGCDLRFDAHLGGYIPAFDSNMQTSIEGVFVAGDVCGIPDANGAADLAERQGARAGRSAAGITDAHAETLTPEAHSVSIPAIQYWQSWRSSLSSGDTGEVAVCLCEEVSRADLQAVSPPRYLGWPSRSMGDRGLATLFEEAPVNLDRLKRLTRAGMGYCQGRRCREEVALISAQAAGVDPSDVPIATYRTPARPLPLRSMWDTDETEETRADWPKWFKRSTIKLESPNGGG